MHFDLTDLRLYLNILDTGNITAGAVRSHLSLAAASARVRAMEASVGIDLLERGRRGVTPTPAGKALAEHARVLLQQAERLQQDMAEYAKGVKGRVRLLCNTSAMTEYLPELLAGFLCTHPNLDIDLQELPSSRITHALRQGAADLGIVSDAVDTDGLQAWPFRDDPLVLILPTGHPLADGRAVRFSETLSHDYVGLNASSALAIYLEEQALHIGSRMQIRIRADGFDGMIRMVAHGAGVAIVPKAAVERRPPEPSYQCVSLQESWTHRALLLCARNFEGLPAYARALARHLAD
ncbi:MULTISPECIES: LysR substrate-binding domain-containing protein [unclassified Pseudomonas]|jgi:DNA-binding transcriptional LysR family regulator|uniref:LysR substrate-binding domain-containing protein n=1 Tax=unclassified Pseudomonas TaxID=196821 RepID=UPI000D6B75DD|nr:MULTISPECIES: LysR substrate-binding domain-containing protein [unclassified Pseudomonas]PWJ38037.1 DNA-binding transcriptional LysR family regulator [Pseudomonas sp. 43mfcvi1.1]QIB05158.1 LysR family transcriptional regulator [Pseudomonas fluorescens]WLH63693.1 LysR substrate-binding domain-containing protein [Pseudomonas sp. FP2300]SSB96373.1 DNA-binding transcriptional regulator, LysR family [Pseudomonas sp. 43mfcvi1.1]